MTNDPIQEIAATALDEAGYDRGKLLVYADVEEGAISTDLFYQPHAASAVKMQFASPRLQDLVYRFWEMGNPPISGRSWRFASLVIENGSFSLDFVYPDQIADDEDASEARLRVVSASFPGATIDYPTPSF